MTSLKRLIFQIWVPTQVHSKHLCEMQANLSYWSVWILMQYDIFQKCGPQVVTQLYYFHFKSYILIFYRVLVYTFYFQKMILVCHFLLVILKIPFKTIYVKKCQELNRCYSYATKTGQMVWKRVKLGKQRFVAGLLLHPEERDRLLPIFPSH